MGNGECPSTTTDGGGVVGLGKREFIRHLFGVCVLAFAHIDLYALLICISRSCG